MKRKIITIKSENDYIKFIKRVSLYKSVLYINTEFQVEGLQENDKVLQIIKGLNIKNRRKRITYVYDTACNIIDNNTKGLNICGFKKNKCYIQQIKNNGKCRPKAAFGVDGAIAAAATITAAVMNGVAMAKAAKTQAKAIDTQASIQSKALNQQNANNNNLQKENIAFTRQQNAENR